MQLLAANQLSKKTKHGRLVQVCFIKHLFLVLFLATRAASEARGFQSSAQIRPPPQKSHINTLGRDNARPSGAQKKSFLLLFNAKTFGAGL